VTSKVKVSIFGRVYAVKGETDSEYIYKLASYVDEKMATMSESLGSKKAANIAILTALNIADEYFQLLKIKSGTELEVVRKTKNMISMLDDGLIGEYSEENCHD
jgi:cell division protein ZapA